MPKSFRQLQAIWAVVSEEAGSGDTFPTSQGGGESLRLEMCSRGLNLAIHPHILIVHKTISSFTATSAISCSMVHGTNEPTSILFDSRSPGHDFRIIAVTEVMKLGASLFGTQMDTVLAKSLFASFFSCSCER
jgi:hypothetical protein